MVRSSRFGGLTVKLVFVSSLMLGGCSKKTTIDQKTVDNFSERIACSGTLQDNPQCAMDPGTLCAYGYCRKGCERDSECAAEVPGAVCLPVADGDTGVCRLPIESDCSSLQCPTGLVCWAAECRAECANDCTLLGLECQQGVCVGTAEGLSPGDGGPSSDSAADVSVDAAADASVDAAADVSVDAAADVSVDAAPDGELLDAGLPEGDVPEGGQDGADGDAAPPGEPPAEPSDVSPASCLSQNPNDWPPRARPYFMFVVDTSGSMAQCVTPYTPLPNPCPPTAIDNSCGLPPTRINHAKCAVRKIVTSYGEFDFGLTGFSQTVTGCGTTSPSPCTPYDASGCSIAPTCSGTGGTIHVGLPVTSGTVGELSTWLDDDCTNGEELLAGGGTPLYGSLSDAAAHLRANASSLGPGCRSINVILIADGEETCDGDAAANNARFVAQDLYDNGLNDGIVTSVRVFVVSFAYGNSIALNQIAEMGGTGVAFQATNEVELQSAFHQIVQADDSVEQCDNRDNDCNGCVDEGLMHYCNQSKTPSAAPLDKSDCCSWSDAMEYEACLNNYLPSIVVSLPEGQQGLLPCFTPVFGADPVTQQDRWLCWDPGEICDDVDNNCDGFVDNAPGLSTPYSLPGCSP